MPPLHPLIIHFPIALFLVAVLFDAITWFTWKPTLNPATRMLMLLSTISAFVAIITGLSLKHQRSAILPHGLLLWHETLAFVFTGWLVLLALIRLRKSFRLSKGYLVMAGIGVVLITLVGHTGGSMAWPSTTALAPATVPGTGKATATAIASPNNTAQNTSKSNSSKPGNQTSASGTASQNANSSGQTTSPPKVSKPTVNQVLYKQGAQFFVRDCQSCHSLSWAKRDYGHLSNSGWTQLVDQMQAKTGGAITNQQTKAIIYYLDHQH